MKSSMAKVTFASIITGILLTSPAHANNGKELSFDRKKGNCIACHLIVGANLPGNIAPPLVAIKARFPDKAVLRAQIFDATIKNPNSLMIPFGRHEVLSSAEVDAVTDYIYTL